MTITEALEQIGGATQVKRSAITNHSVLNEAYDYQKPSSFSRGLRIDLNGLAILLISGTASIDQSLIDAGRALNAKEIVIISWGH